jgi:hypothetical protein
LFASSVVAILPSAAATEKWFNSPVVVDYHIMCFEIESGVMSMMATP